MVRAVNAGGEAQSIADFAVMEPTPERMVEVVKTVVFDSTNDKKVKFNSLISKTVHIIAFGSHCTRNNLSFSLFSFFSQLS